MAEKSTREKTILATYAEIQRCDQNGDYERALKAANRILHMEAQDALAFNCKIICLIHLGKFEEALQQMNKNPSISQDLHFVKAYCYYRLNRHQEALKVLDELGDDVELPLKELKAQVLYRLENYGGSADLYQDIIKNSSEEYEDEYFTNLSAALVYLDNNSAINNLKESSYEVCFNKACWLAQNGQYLEAEKKLKQCEKQCREALEEEEATEEEIEVDLALIRIQLGFVYQKLGRIKEAHQLYTSTLKIKVEDQALVAVASNNVVCINKDQNIFDSKKKIKHATNEQLVHKLPSSTRKYITLNSAVLACYTNQYQLCNQICLTIEKSWPDLFNHTSVLLALSMLKTNKAEEAIKLLKERAKANSNSRTFLMLCCVHLYLMQDNKEAACVILEELGAEGYKPGIIGALITLYLSLGQEETALKVFERAVDWYKKNRVEGDLTVMWRQAADFHIRNGQPQVAAHSLEELLQKNPKDKKTIAKLILAYSQFDSKKAIELGKKLPDVDVKSEGFDLESLESTVWINNKKTVVSAKGDSLPSTPKSSETKKKKHKKRKGKLPKNYDPNVNPDPERWLPKYERAGYRKKRDRRFKEVIKGSQGMASGQSEQFDFSSKRSEETQTQETSSGDKSPKSKIHHPKKAGQQKKKSKKR